MAQHCDHSRRGSAHEERLLGHLADDCTGDLYRTAEDQHAERIFRIYGAYLISHYLYAVSLYGKPEKRAGVKTADILLFDFIVGGSLSMRGLAFADQTKAKRKAC